MRATRTRQPQTADVAGYRFRVVSLVLFLSTVFQSTGVIETRGQDRSEPVRVAHLIDRLGSSSFARRQAAERALLELDEPPITPLEKAVAGTDPEVSLRAEKLLNELKTRRMWSPSMIQQASGDQLASEILRNAATESGNRLAFGGRFDNFVDRKIQVLPGRAPYWQVVDHVCRQTNNHLSFRRQPETGATVIVAGAPGKHPVAYAGPLRVFLKQARREFSESLDYEDRALDLKHTFAIDIATNWETRCRLLAHRSEAYVVAAVTDSGQRLLAAPGTSGGWNVVPVGAGQVETTLRLQPPSVAASQLAKLHLRWELVAASDMQTIDITDMETPRVYRRDDVELVFEGVEKVSDTRYEASIVVKRAAFITELKGLAETHHEIGMIDDHKQSMSVHSRSTENSSTSRRKTPFLVQGTRIVTSFVADKPERKPASIHFRYPKIRSLKAVDIVFRDVPLPSSPLD